MDFFLIFLLSQIFQSFQWEIINTAKKCGKYVLRKFQIPQIKGFGYPIHPYLLMCTLIWEWEDPIPHGIPNTIAAANKYIYFRHKKNCLASGTSLQNYYPRICYPIFVLIEYICDIKTVSEETWRRWCRRLSSDSESIYGTNNT